MTQSPTRSGWVTASMIPATRLASVWRAAKPTIAATSAPEASKLPATRPSPANCEQRASTPISEQHQPHEPADEAQPRVGLLGDPAAHHAVGELAPARREPAVEHEGDQDEDREDDGGPDRRRAPSTSPVPLAAIAAAA